MRDPQQVLLRLAATAAIAVLACFFACRPDWSPDGKQLLFTAKDVDGPYIASYDRETGKVARVSVPPRFYAQTAAFWTASGERAVVLSKPQTARPDGIRITETSVPVDGKVRTLSIEAGKKSWGRNALASTAIIGRHAFVGDGDITRLDLDTGETRIVKAGDGECLVVGRRGDGLCYVGVTPVANGERVWVVGVLDPETLQRTELLRSKDLGDLRVQPMPAFSPDLERIAMPSASGDAVVVFRNGQLETTVPVGTVLLVNVQDIAWSRHGEKIFVTLNRQVGDDYQWSLFESTVGGSVQRETVLFETPSGSRFAGRDPTLGVAISPDGRVAAFTTAYVPDVAAEDHGLYLVDLVGGKRTVTKVAFPVPDEITMCGSDVMLRLAEQWRSSYRSAHAGHSLSVLGGGTGAGIAMLIAGRTDLSMATRQASAAELDCAKEAGVVLEEHCVVRSVAAICVRKDNPIRSLTVAQLAAVFNCDSTPNWSDFGIGMSYGEDRVEAGLRHHDAASYAVLHSALFRRAKYPAGHKVFATDPGLVGFAADHANALVAIDNADSARADARVRIVAIAPDAATTPCLPDPEAIASGRYPLTNVMYVYSRKGAAANVATFLAWVKGDGGSAATAAAGHTPAK